MNPTRRRRLGGNKNYLLKAAHFAGASSQIMSIADNAALSMGAGVHPTIAFWVYPESFAAITRPFGKYVSTADGGYFVQITTGGIPQFRLADGTSLAAMGNTAIALNTWSLVVAYYDGATAGLSVNNGAFVSGAWTTDIKDDTAAFALGLVTSNPFTGSLDSAGVWKRVLTANEITMLYNGGVGLAYQDLGAGMKTSLVAWYDLDDPGGSGATWVDKASTNNLTAGTTTAAPTSVPGKR